MPKPNAATTTAEPKHILVLDNGGDTIKYGWAVDDTENSPGPPAQDTNHRRPARMPNRTARLPQQWKILIGDQMETQVTNPNACIHVTPSLERGILTHLGNQIQVWKHILDRLHVSIPGLEKSPTAQCFGWTTHKTNSSSSSCIPSHQCAVLIGMAPYTPRTILDAVLAIWMDDFHCARVGFFVSTVAAARPTRFLRTATVGPMEKEEVVPMACVVDMGDSAIHVIPVYHGKVLGPIRRMPFGGKHLRQLWKYYCTYRQWNLMDAPYIVRDIMEQTSFISLQYRNDLQLARRRPFGQRPYDCQYVLPNYTTTFRGVLVIPETVMRMEQSSIEAEELHRVENEDEDDDEDYDETDMKAEEAAMENEDNEDEMEDEEEESLEQARIRLLKQREEERRLRAAQQDQVLDISTERFSICEALFHPSDVGLPSEWANLPQAILQAIQACPAVYHAGLYRSIQLTGGLSQLPNLKERLELELRSVAPYQYAVNISISDTPIDQAWTGAVEMARQQPMEQWSIRRDEWERSSSKRGAWKRLLMHHGGHMV
jgi:actin-related protein